MKVAVVDVDDTLLFGSPVSWFFWRLARIFQRLGRRFQVVDPLLAARLQRYDRVIILTGRDLSDREFTMKQLKRAGVQFEGITCCPRKTVLTKWKVSEVQRIAEDNTNPDWIDDALGKDPLLRDSISSVSVNPVDPAKMQIKVRKSDSELEWV